MLRALAMLGLAAARQPLGSRNVDGLPANELRALCDRCERGGGWWVQLGPWLYSPALGGGADRELERANEGATTGEFALYRGFPLPAKLQPFVTGQHEDHFLLRSSALDGAFGRAACAKLLPAGTQLSLPAQDIGGEQLHNRLCDNIAPVGPGMQASVPATQLLTRTPLPELERIPQPASAHGEAAIKAADNPEAYMQELGNLLRFSKRNVLSTLHPSEKGVDEARDYLRAQLEELGMETRLQKFSVPRREFSTIDHDGPHVEGYNVIGCWPGTVSDEADLEREEEGGKRRLGGGSNEQVLLIGAHYDAMPDAPISEETESHLERDLEREEKKKEFGWHGSLPEGVHTAPGAMDDGSGVAVVLQTLRALANRAPAAGAETGVEGTDAGARATMLERGQSPKERLPLRDTLYAAFFSAEEQGYYGSMAAVQALTGVHRRNLDPEHRNMDFEKMTLPSDSATAGQLRGGKATFGGALILDMTTEFKGAGSDGVEHPPCHWQVGGVCDTIMLDTQSHGHGSGDGANAGGEANVRMMQELLGATKTHTKSAETVRVTQNPQSDFHTDATPFWRANLPAVYAATKDHRIYQHWHGPHDQLKELGGELGADIATMATGWIASRAAPQPRKGAVEAGDGALERAASKGKARSTCFSHFEEGSLQQTPRPFQMERLSIDAALEKAHHALSALQPE